MEVGTGVVIKLRLAPYVRSCFDCVYHEDADTRDGTEGLVSWCGAYDEAIDSEVYSAEDCSTYEWSDHDR